MALFLKSYEAPVKTGRTEKPYVHENHFDLNESKDTYFQRYTENVFGIIYFGKLSE